MKFNLAEIQSLIARFKRQELPAKEWTHDAHLVVAIWFCWYHSYEEALLLVRDLIINHNVSVGTPNTDTEGYHETLTRFWLRVASLFLNNNNFDSIESACNAFVESQFSSREFPLNYYSKDTLFSLNARHGWVQPDLMELDLKI